MALTTADFNELREVFNKECERLLNIKGEEYTRGQNDDNRVENFERLAETLGTTPLQALGMYLFKHLDSISYYIKTGQGGPQSEPILGRLADARNYIDLMYGMLHSSEVVLVPTANVSNCTCFVWSGANIAKRGPRHARECPMYRLNDESEEVVGE